MIADGVAKLNRFAVYEELDWTADPRQRIGIAEVMGGTLMLLRPTRRLAGVVSPLREQRSQRNAGSIRSIWAAPERP